MYCNRNRYRTTNLRPYASYIIIKTFTKYGISHIFPVLHSYIYNGFNVQRKFEPAEFLLQTM